jgi:hypothetical protein
MKILEDKASKHHEVIITTGSAWAPLRHKGYYQTM